MPEAQAGLGQTTVMNTSADKKYPTQYSCTAVALARQIYLARSSGLSSTYYIRLQMSWLLPYNRNYFLCNYQTYPQTDVVWVIDLLISPLCEGNKKDSHDKKSSTLGDQVPEYP